MSELFANIDVLRRAAAPMAALAMSALLGSCAFVNQDHCAYMLESGMDSPCSDEQVCSKCKPDNNGCVVPGDVEEGCVLVVGGSTTMSTTDEPTGAASVTTDTGGTASSGTTSTTEPSTADEATTVDPYSSACRSRPERAAGFCVRPAPNDKNQEITDH